MTASADDPPPRLVLASASPRRADLLSVLGVPFDVDAADVDESPLEDELAAAYVDRIARAKADARVGPGRIVIAADTTVVLEGAILGKPVDADHARLMLRTLSGRTHEVLTCAVVRTPTSASSNTDVARVTFAEISDREIDWYVATGEPFDKAGAYGILGAGGYLVSRVEGCVQTVVGMSLRSVVGLLRCEGYEALLGEKSL